MRWLDSVYRAALALESSLTVSEWADKHRVLPSTSAEPGRWRTSRTPYLREIMNALSPASPVETVVLMKSGQCGGTEVALNFIAYIVAHAPGLALVVMPSLDMARRNVRTRFDPMIASTPALRERIAKPRSRDSENTAFTKSFPGGAIIFTGANSASALRSTPIRYLVLDEIDSYPTDLDGEGDAVSLALQRTVTFKGRRKILMVSTPTIAGASRIEAAYGESDQRRYYVPCPHCQHMQVLTFAGIKWPAGEPSKAYYACEGCGGVIEEREKPALLAAGEWRPLCGRVTRPHNTGSAADPVSEKISSRLKPFSEADALTAGFHISALYSPFESWAAIATDFLASKRDPARMQTWTNLKLGEAFEDRDVEPLSPDVLQARAEPADPPWTEMLPAGVAVIVAGADIQDDRIELESLGVGRGEECWSLDYVILHGDTSQAGVWQALDRELARRFRHPTAVSDLPIAACAIDSGHRTDIVMRFAAERANRRVWAVKGRGGAGVPPWPKRPPKPRRGLLAPVYRRRRRPQEHALRPPPQRR